MNMDILTLMEMPVQGFCDSTFKPKGGQTKEVEPFSIDFDDFDSGVEQPINPPEINSTTEYPSDNIARADSISSNTEQKFDTDTNPSEKSTGQTSQQIPSNDTNTQHLATKSPVTDKLHEVKVNSTQADIIGHRAASGSELQEPIQTESSINIAQLVPALNENNSLQGDSGSQEKNITDNIRNLVPAVEGEKSGQVTGSDAAENEILVIHKSQQVPAQSLTNSVTTELNADISSPKGNTSVQNQQSNKADLSTEGTLKESSKSLTDIVAGDANATKDGIKTQTDVSPLSNAAKLVSSENKVPNVEQKQPDLSMMHNTADKAEPRLDINASNSSEIATKTPALIVDGSKSEKTGQAQQDPMPSLLSDNKDSVNTLVNKLSNTQNKLSQSTADSSDNSSSHSNYSSRLEQMVSNNDGFNAEQITNSSQETRLDNNELINSASARINAQIEQSIRSSLKDGNQQITIRLNPPELGRVSIKFQEQGDQITCLMEVSKAQTRYEIEQQLTQIAQNLADSGVQIKRFEVTLTDQQQQQAFREQTMQDGNLPHDDSAPQQSNTNGDSTKQGDWIENNETGLNGFTETEQTFVSEGVIDILA